MPRGDFLGEFEQMLLLALARLEEGAYGMAIRDEIESCTGQNVAIGSVYSALDRLERAGYLTSTLGDPTPERGGRAKRFYRLEFAGTMALQRSRRALASLWEGVELGPTAEPS
jgi:DNA-binding PadR family transcriptional regulator